MSQVSYDSYCNILEPLWKVQSSKLPVSSGNSKTAPQQLPSIEEENRDSRGSLTRSGGSMNPKGSDEGSLLVTSPEEEEEMLGGVDKLHLSSLDQTTEDETRVVIPVVIPKHLIESSLRSHNNASGIKVAVLEFVIVCNLLNECRILNFLL